MFKRNIIGFRCHNRTKCNIPTKTFGEAVGVTGIVLTKLDGTAKGGIIIAVSSELNIPVKFIGVGETSR